jgi:hypothetical protein
MDKDKHLKSVYPTATRGNLANNQIHKKYQARPLTQSRDYSPQSLIFQAVIICLVIGLLGIGSYIYYFTRIRNQNPTTVAYAVARKVSELNSSQTYYDQLETETASTFNWCKAPIITVTYYYGRTGETKRTDNTVIDTGKIKSITALLDEIVQKADSAIKSDYDITCPNNPSV